jgi:5,10-methylenetetrahydromethanopterin reductase
MGEVAVTDDLAGERDRLRPRCVLMAGGEYAAEMLARYGLTVDDVEPVRRAVKAGDLVAAGRAVNDRVVDAFCVVGSADGCRDTLREMARAGVTHVICSIGAGASEPDLTRMLQTLGREIVAPLASA